MTKVAIYKDSQNEYRGFQVKGHAEYAPEDDVLCSAISTLTITILNALEELTDQEMEYIEDEEAPTIILKLKGEILPEAKLLMDTYVLGLKSMVGTDYDDYFQLFFKEV